MNPLRRPFRFASLAACPLFVALGAFAQPAPKPDVAPQPASTPKPYAIFVGTDISVEKDKKLYRIQAVAGDSFVISVDGKADLVPMHGKPHALKLQQDLKLTGATASVSGLTAERAYTPGNDPRMKRQIQGMRVEAALGDGASLAEGQFIAAQNKGYVAFNANAPVAGIDTSIKNQEINSAAASAKAAEAQAMVDAQITSQVSGGANTRQQAEADLALELFDAIEVNFHVSSPNPLTDPYVVLIAHYHEKNAKPGITRNLIYARAVEKIGTTPQKVLILQGGLPPGYILDSYQVHLYNLGTEVATDASAKRVPLTRDEAFAYLVAEYLGTHKGATLPAAAVLGRLAPETKSRLTSQQISSPYFVRVSKDGLPLEVYLDQECTRPADATMDALVKNDVRFYPALDKGKRTEGVARLMFTHLTL
jgi:hypothetical protein